MISDWIETVLFVLIAIMLCFLVVILSVAAFDMLADGKTVLATLKESEWTCTDTATERHNQMVGKVVVPKDVEVCIEYKHK